MHGEIAGYITKLNAKLNRWESIKKFLVLDHDLTVESGELTPSMKVKRRVVEDNYKDVISGFYSEMALAPLGPVRRGMRHRVLHSSARSQAA